MAEEKRLDVLIFEKRFVSSREKAQDAIKSRRVSINGKIITKPGTKLPEDTDIKVINEAINFVSRGGLKLQKAIENFNLSVRKSICIDFGASTGGFTDCLLQHGAEKVYAIDVGYDQLDKSLREDSRVINLEKTNLRDLSESHIPEKADFACADISFISLKFLFPVMKDFLKEDGIAVCLIKPQFEAGRENIGKNGIVKDKKVHIKVISTICGNATENGFCPLNIDYSPIRGTKGNIEYLILLKKSKDNRIIDLDKIKSVVETAHKQLNGGV